MVIANMTTKKKLANIAIISIALSRSPSKISDIKLAQKGAVLYRI